jgi:hypothetical protein
LGFPYIESQDERKVSLNYLDKEELGEIVKDSRVRHPSRKYDTGEYRI